MNLHDLEAFVAVVEQGSVGAAATRLHVTQPAVTRRLQSLESALGTRLLDRETRPPQPTVHGRAVLEQARRDRKTPRLNSRPQCAPRMPSSARTQKRDRYSRNRLPTEQKI